MTRSGQLACWPSQTVTIYVGAFKTFLICYFKTLNYLLLIIMIPLCHKTLKATFPGCGCGSVWLPQMSWVCVLRSSLVWRKPSQTKPYFSPAVVFLHTSSLHLSPYSFSRRLCHYSSVYCFVILATTREQGHAVFVFLCPSLCLIHVATMTECNLHG